MLIDPKGDEKEALAWTVGRKIGLVLVILGVLGALFLLS